MITQTGSISSSAKETELALFARQFPNNNQRLAAYIERADQLRLHLSGTAHPKNETQSDRADACGLLHAFQMAMDEQCELLNKLDAVLTELEKMI